ncbi:MAG: rubredoxin-like domain-containing protein [Haloarculaceae archaeon]
MNDPAEPHRIAFGEAVYDAEGNRLGVVRGADEHGFYVTTDDGIEALSSEHVRTGTAGEAELMWRCWSCGAMGEIDELPAECPDCGAPKEELYYWTED